MCILLELINWCSYVIVFLKENHSVELWFLVYENVCCFLESNSCA